jgi:hypothetical protein
MTEPKTLHSLCRTKKGDIMRRIIAYKNALAKDLFCDIINRLIQGCIKKKNSVVA